MRSLSPQFWGVKSFFKPPILGAGAVRQGLLHPIDRPILNRLCHMANANLRIAI